jgi:hypothetical protein
MVGKFLEAAVNFNFLLVPPLGEVTEEARLFAARGGDLRMPWGDTVAFFVVPFFPFAFFNVSSSGNFEDDRTFFEAFSFAAFFADSASFNDFSFASFASLAARAASAPALFLAILIEPFQTQVSNTHSQHSTTPRWCSLDPKFKTTHKASTRLQAGLTSTRIFGPNGESEEQRDADRVCVAREQR